MDKETMSKHTQEPWFVGTISADFKRTDEPVGPEFAICSSGGSFDKPDGTMHGNMICRGMDGPMSEANARRIVACVNACAGISTESLEKNPGATNKGIADYVQTYLANETLQTRLDAVSGALRECQELACLPHLMGDDEAIRMLSEINKRARAALASIGEGVV